MAEKKMGRPSDNRKDFLLRVRLDSDDVEHLNFLEEKLHITK